MNPTAIIVRFDTVAEQAAGPVLRIVGFAKARDLLQMLDSADLEANPRSAKAGPVTEDILESIAETPDIFVFKTKGILIGASSYEKLQRNRRHPGWWAQHARTWYAHLDACVGRQRSQAQDPQMA